MIWVWFRIVELTPPKNNDLPVLDQILGPNIFFFTHTQNTVIHIPDAVSRVMTCQWTSENQSVVLEIPDDENSKSTSDSERCTWAELLAEMEENKVTDPTINLHELHAPVMDDAGIQLSSPIVMEIQMYAPTIF